MTEALQAQGSPQEGVSEPLLPGGPAQEARCIPWGSIQSPCRSLVLSVIQQTSTAPSLTLGVMPLSAHGVAEFPFYR